MKVHLLRHFEEVYTRVLMLEQIIDTFGLIISQSDSSLATSCQELIS
jgi:hypothetical protein